MFSPRNLFTPAGDEARPRRLFPRDGVTTLVDPLAAASSSVIG